MTDEIRWFVGIDWASESHQIYLLDARGQCLGERSVSHGGAGLSELCDWLATKTGASPAAIAVAIEVPHGPVVEVLLERGFQVYAINPKQLDRRPRRDDAFGRFGEDDRPGLVTLAGGPEDRAR